MRMRVALGIGALALLIVGLVAWGGFDQPTLNGRVLVVGPANLPLAADKQDIAAFSLCVPRGGTVFVHVLPFTRMLDARGRLFTTAARVDALRPGQRVQIWTTNEPITFSPPQVSAVKIKITADPVEGDAASSCQSSE
jgi:hypothetical protein